MLSQLARNWWIFLLRGFAALLFGLAVFIYPLMALSLLVSLVTAYFFIDGVFTSAYALQNRDRPRWWVTLLEGFVGIIAGISALALGPIDVGFTLLYIIAFWAVLTGLMQIMFAIEMRKQIQNELWMILSGVVSILFGSLVVLFPGAGALTVLSIIGAYAFVSGIILIIFAFRLRSRGNLTNERIPSV